MVRTCGCLLLFCMTAFASPLEQPLPPGLVSQRPANGVSIETELGFMVPYKAKIPGSSVAIEMIPIAGGVAVVGSPTGEAGRNAEDEPLRQIRVEPYWIGKYEVTIEQYRYFMQMYSLFRKIESAHAGSVDPDDPFPLYEPVTDKNRIDAVTAPTEVYEPSYHFEFGDDKHPVSTVTQFGARQFTKWLSLMRGQKEFYRLPTEAEWEHACRAGTKTAYHFGDDPAALSKYATFRGETESYGPTLVGTKLPNGWGLYDMSGNVAEWVIDAPGPRTPTQPNAQPIHWKEAIVWATSIEFRMLRGGGWTSTPAECRSAAKMSSSWDWWDQEANRPRSPWWLAGDEVTQAVGFRIVRSLRSLPRAEQERFWSPDCRSLEEDVNKRLKEGRGVIGIASPQLAPELDAYERQRQLDTNRANRKRANPDNSTDK